VEVFVRPGLDAYYYSFEPTGDADIDRILGAVAYAGKAYHYTDSWTDDDVLAVSCEQNIQNAANLAALSRQSLTAREPATADVGRENHQLRNALIAMGRMIPGVMLADQVSSDFLGNLPDELAHYTLSRAAPSSGHAMAEGEAA
jgi:hypothetical protein